MPSVCFTPNHIRYTSHFTADTVNRRESSSSIKWLEMRSWKVFSFSESLLKVSFFKKKWTNNNSTHIKRDLWGCIWNVTKGCMHKVFCTLLKLTQLQVFILMINYLFSQLWGRLCFIWYFHIQASLSLSVCLWMYFKKLM